MGITLADSEFYEIRAVDFFFTSAGCFHILYFDRETDPSSLLGSQTSL